MMKLESDLSKNFLRRLREEMEEYIQNSMQNGDEEE